MSDRLRWIIWSLSVAILFGIGILWSQFSRIEEGALERIGYWIVAGIAMLGAVFAFPKINRRTSYVVLGIAIVGVRLAFWGCPESNDVNRFLWEGRLIWMGENPYETVADDEKWSHLRDGYWQEMNNRHLKTAYPPGMELFMAGASRVWYQPEVFKVLALLGDFWTIAILFLMIRQFGKPIQWLGFYAFNPLILSSFAAEAHFDSLMVAPMLTALWLGSRRSWKWAWFWLGFAVQMKIMALVLAPLFFLCSERAQIVHLFSRPSLHAFGALLRNTFRQIWPFFVILTVPCFFFWGHMSGMVSGLFVFGSKGSFNGGLYEVFQLIGIDGKLTRWVLLSIFTFSYGLICFRILKKPNTDIYEVGFWALLTLVITSPIVHFWYLSWVLWYMALRPKASLLLLSGTVAVYFLTWHNLQAGIGWWYPKWIVVFITWTPFFLVHLWESRHALATFRNFRFPKQILSPFGITK